MLLPTFIGETPSPSINVQNWMNGLTIRIPTITITEPKNNISIQSDSITIKGIVDPKNSQLQIEGKEVSIKDGSFEYEAKLTEENSLIILIADNSGKKT